MPNDLAPGPTGGTSTPEPRRQFRLPEADEAYLDARGFRWETVIENQVRRLIIHDYPVCDGYNVKIVTLNLRIETVYPDGQIDMVYFHPSLARADGKQIGALTQENFDGRSWQRWSRHRTANNAWIPGIDCVETHLLLVDSWLEREFTLRP